MKIYRNNHAKFQYEITEIECEKDTQRGKIFYSVTCYFLLNKIAPNGDKTTQAAIGTTIKSRKELTPDFLLNYFNNEIQNRCKLIQ